MTDQLPTYHGSPEDEGQHWLSQVLPEETDMRPVGHEIAPRRPDAGNMQLNPDEVALQKRISSETDYRSFLNRLIGLFTGGGQQDDLKAELDTAIDRYPEAASNFVLRGELLLKRGQLAEAKADFLRAYEIASQNVTDAQFGFVAQMTQDRALDGLKRAEAALDAAD